MSHPADQDYSAQNMPNEAELTEMMESALFLAEMAQGKGRRRVDAEGRGWRLPEGTKLVQNARSGELAVATKRADDKLGRPYQEIDPREIPNFQEDIFNEALAKAEAERGQLSPVDSQMVTQAIAVIQSWVSRLRDLPAAGENAILGHALNSIELGLIGLAKVKETPA